jgi:hypothetical protein
MFPGMSVTYQAAGSPDFCSLWNTGGYALIYVQTIQVEVVSPVWKQNVITLSDINFRKLFAINLVLVFLSHGQFMYCTVSEMSNRSLHNEIVTLIIALPL